MKKKKNRIASNVAPQRSVRGQRTDRLQFDLNRGDELRPFGDRPPYVDTEKGGRLANLKAYKDSPELDSIGLPKRRNYKQWRALGSSSIFTIRRRGF